MKSTHPSKTVAVATLETEGGSVEEDLGTVGQGELAAAKITLLIVLRSLLLGGGTHNPPAGGGNGAATKPRKGAREYH